MYHLVKTSLCKRYRPPATTLRCESRVRTCGRYALPSAYQSAYQCLTILSQRQFRAPQLREKSTRNTARKHAGRHLTRAFHGVGFHKWSFDGFVTSEKWSLVVVTALGHPARYPPRNALKPWMPEWIPAAFPSNPTGRTDRKWPELSCPVCIACNLY